VEQFIRPFRGRSQAASKFEHMTSRARLLLSYSLITGVVASTGLAAAAGAGHLGSAHAGHQSDGSVITSTGQRITPAGHQLEFPGRPTAMAIRPDGRTAALLNSQGGELVVVDLTTRKIKQTYTDGGGSYDGVAYSPKGDRLFASDAGGDVLDLSVAADGTVTKHAAIASPATKPGSVPTDINASASNAYPGGLTFSPDGKRVYVAYSVLNQLGVIDVATDSVVQQIDVGNAPHSVVLSGNTAWVSNEGGRPATNDDFSNDSDGTAIVADKVHGAAKTGTVSVVNLTEGKEVATVKVGLHPTALALDGSTLYVANTYADSVSVVDTSSRSVRATIDITPYRLERFREGQELRVAYQGAGVMG